MSKGLTISKVISTFVEKTKLKVKVFLTGLINVQSAHQVAPYGIDSNPIADMKAIYGQTEVNGRPVIIGYINKNVLAEEGDIRLFSTDANGLLKMFVWLKNDGTLELGGSAKHLARFEELETGFNQLKADFNAFLTHVHGGSGTPPTPPATPSTASISAAKIEEIKTL